MRTGEGAAAGATVFPLLKNGSTSGANGRVRNARAAAGCAARDSAPAALWISKAPRSVRRRRLAAEKGGRVEKEAEAALASRDWLCWQLADSAFPTGGFAHSAGLESAWQHGEVRNREELVSFVNASLQQLGRGALPFVLAVYDEPERAGECDRLCEAFTTNPVANRASRVQGKAMLSALARIFPEIRKAGGQEPGCGSEALEPPARHSICHFAPAFGLCMRRLGVARGTAGRLFFFNHLRGLLAAAVRLNIVGPMEAQALQRRLAPSAEAMFERCRGLSLADIAQTSPLLDLWQGAHDRLYSRLFQS